MAAGFRTTSSEARFGRNTRMLASALFAFMRIGWMAAMVYAPTLAIISMGKLDDRWFWPLILVQGVSSTIFTVLVGVRGVVITDALQMVIIALGITATIGFALAQLPLPLAAAWNDVVHSGRFGIQTVDSASTKGSCVCCDAATQTSPAVAVRPAQ